MSAIAVAWLQFTYSRWVMMRIHTPASDSRHSASEQPSIWGHVAQDAALDDREVVQPVEVGAGEAPLVEVPAPLEREGPHVVTPSSSATTSRNAAV